MREKSLIDQDFSGIINRCLFFVFILLLALIKFKYHELWKDEWQAWLIANDFENISSMISFLPFEGHPSLWFLYLRLVGNLGFLMTSNAELLIQLSHFILAIPFFYLLFIKIKIPVWQKIGFSSSYYFFFEYGVINRSYILLCLSTILLVYYINDYEKHKIKILIILFLLTQTEIYGIFIAFSFCFYLIRDVRMEWKKIIVVGSVLLLGLIVFALTVFSSTANPIEFQFNFLESLKGVLLFSLFPALYISLKNSDVLSLLLCAGYLYVIWLLFKSNKKILFTYVIFLLLMTGFCSTIYIGGPRQWGVHFLFLTGIMAMTYTSFQGREKYIATSLISIILLFQIFHTLNIVNKETKYLFSNSKPAGLFIKKYLGSSDIVAINKAYATPVIGYSGKKFYSLPEGELFSYFKFGERVYIPSMRDLSNFKQTRLNPLIVISYKPLSLKKYQGIELMQAFDKPNIREENYYLYLVK